MSCGLNTPSHSKALNDERIQSHPCYSKDAHQYARLHLPVAPACNIQCNYCNRKFDCSNESRPGVVSKVLSPVEAIQRFSAIKKRMPELKVVGIAGPGDALANPKASFATLKAIKSLDDDLHLCISTNGLALPQSVEQLVQLGVNHLTITMNTLRPEVAELLYPWIYHDHQRWVGREAAELLIEQQLLGLSMAAEAGLLVKVNTVLIPGVTDVHIEELSKELKLRGALLHNLMPLISDPSHGTYFGVSGVMGPNDQQLERARARSGQHMDQMSHCQQCRADAVGRLDNDQSCQTQERPALGGQAIRIALAHSDNGLIDKHFGYATAFDIYQHTDQGFVWLEQRAVSQFCHGAEQCADSEASIELMVDALQDCSMLLCSRIGMGPWQHLEAKGIRPRVDLAMRAKTEVLQLLHEEINQQSTRMAEVG